jgi:Mg2+ and Co2+ transporter CorA
LHVILRKDIRQLIMNADKVQKDLEMLEQSHAIRIGKPQQNDLRQIIKHVKSLESNVATMLSDCVSLGRQHWKGHNLPLIYSLRRSNIIINRVLKDLNKIIAAPCVAFTNSEELRQTAMYLGQFKKSINGIQKSVNYTRGRRKNYAWARKGSKEL